MQASTVTLRPDLLQFFDHIAAGDMEVETLLSSCQRGFAADVASLFWGSVESNFHLIAKAGDTNWLPDHAEIKLGFGIAGTCIERQRAALVIDPRNDPEFTNRRHKKHAGIGSAMICPLFHGGTAVGVMNLTRFDTRPPFDDSDLQLASLVASALGAIFRGAFLDAEMKAERQRLSVMFDGLGVGFIVFSVSGTVFQTNQPEERVKEVQESLLQAEGMGLDVNGTAVKLIGGRKTRMRRVELSRELYAITLEDVQPIIDLEQEVARSQRLAEVGMMTAAVAHEIRNPLTSIKSALQLCKTAPDFFEEGIGIATDEVEKLNLLCEDFLDFAKPLEIKPTAGDMKSCLTELCRKLRPKSSELGVRLTLQSSGKIPTMKQDWRRIEQAARNLIDNALLASQPGGVVRVVIVSDGFDVIDNGCGMTEEQMSRLFIPFASGRSRGTGLGLTNVKRILDAHGATVSFTSTPAGTSVSVRFLRRAA